MSKSAHYQLFSPISTSQKNHPLSILFSISIFFQKSSVSQLKIQKRDSAFLGRYRWLIFIALFIGMGSVLVEEQVAKAANASQTNETLLIHFEPETSEAKRKEVLDNMNATLVDWTAALHMAEVIIKDTGGVTASLSKSTFSDPAIATVESDLIIVRGTYMPNDPALQDWQKSYAQEVLQLETAWDYTLGHHSTVIAVLDTGLNPQHSEFDTPVVAGYDFVNNRADFRDDHGHGTHIAGILAAQINNEIGTVGICPRCGLIAVKVLNADNYGTWSTVAKGIVFAVDNNADIINLSLGSDQSSASIEKAIQYAQEKGVLIIAASGNEHSNVEYYPAAYEGVIGVSATDDRDEHWVLSNHGRNIDLSAPGYMIYSTGIGENLTDNDAFSYMSGTSMAAPHVAGIAGLLLSQDANRSAEEIAGILFRTSRDLGEKGWDGKFGHGRVDAARALADAGIAPTRTTQEAAKVSPKGESKVEKVILEPDTVRQSSFEILLPLVTN